MQHYSAYQILSDCMLWVHGVIPTSIFVKKIENQTNTDKISDYTIENIKTVLMLWPEQD